MEKIRNYLSSDLIKFIFPFLLSLFTYSIYIYYNNSENLHILGDEIQSENKTKINYMFGIAKIQEITNQIFNNSLERTNGELEYFYILSKLDIKLPNDSLQSISLTMSKYKLEVAIDKGTLDEYSMNNNQFGNINYYALYSDLLNLEFQAIDNLEEYVDFRINHSSKPTSYKILDREVENSTFKLFGKITEIMQRVNPDKFKPMGLDQKQKLDKEFDSQIEKINRLVFKINLSIFGISISGILIILMTYFSLKLNLFGNSVIKKKRINNER